jgi:hypothetical protein
MNAEASKNAVLSREGGVVVLRITEDRAVVLDDQPDVWEILRKHKIFLWKPRETYPACKIDGKKVYLHHLLVDVPAGMCVHHVDGNLFHCCRSNLVVGSKIQLMQRAKRLRSPVPGVYTRKTGYMATWRCPDTGRRKHELQPFRKFPGEKSFVRAETLTAKMRGCATYPLYYFNPSPIKT